MAENNQNNEKNYGARDAARQVQRTAKGTKAAVKMGANIATGNYVGAIKEFFKDPKGVIIGVIVPLFLVICFLFLIVGNLVSSFWNALTDTFGTPDTSMVDAYCTTLKEVETDCFNKAYKHVSDNALKDICDEMNALDLGDNNENKKTIFKNKNVLQDYLGYGYNQMRMYKSNSYKYPMYESVLLGQENFLSLTEDESNGYAIEITNEDNQATYWNNTTNIFDFNIQDEVLTEDDKNNGKTVPYKKVASQETLNQLNKVQYRFTYNNGNFNENGISMSYFQTLFNAKYDYEHKKSVESIARIIEQQINLLDQIDVTNATYISSLNSIINNYDALKTDTYYLDAQWVNMINARIEKYNKANDAQYEKIGNRNKDIEFIQDLPDKKTEAFIDFMKQDEVYKKLLTYKINIKDNNNVNSKYMLTGYNVGTKENPQNSVIYIKNIKRIIDIEISVDICDNNTIAQIFGFKDENGNENEEFINFVLSSDGKKSSEDSSNQYTEETENTESEENTEASSKTTETSSEPSSTLTTSSTSKLTWPVNIENNKVSVTQEFGNRINPVTGSPEFHKGIDIGAVHGMPITAAAEGKVEFSGYESGGYGNYIIIKHKDGTKTLYAHCSARYVYAGNKVKQGQKIAAIGSTGQSTGPHIHFEYISASGEYKNPRTILEGSSYMYISALYDFSTIEGYLESCKSAGEATAQILNDAGYVRSSIYWQYKKNVYKVMFSSAAIYDSKLPFFVDVENIARNPDGSLKIVEYDTAKMDGDGYLLSNLWTSAVSDEEDKKYYVVYCQPNTVVTNQISCMRTKFNYEQSTNKFYDMVINKTGLEEGGGYNMYLNNIGNGAVVVNKIEDASRPFTYSSYAFTNMSYGFEVDNIQVTAPNESQQEYLISSNIYYSNSKYIHNKVRPEQTINEYFANHGDDSYYQINEPVILGSTLDANLYPINKDVDVAYDVNDTDTYPFFVVSASITAPSVIDAVKKEVDIYEIFDLDVVDGQTYNSTASGYTWPVLKSYEAESQVTPQFSGTIKELKNNSLIIQIDEETFVKISNINTSATLVNGQSINKNTILGTIDYGMQMSTSVGEYVNEKYKQRTSVNTTTYFKTTLVIDVRDELSLNEDSVGKYDKVVSMFNGVVKKITGNSIEVYSSTTKTYYKYTNVSVSDYIQVGTMVSGGEVIGKAYTLNSDEKDNEVLVNVYIDSPQENAFSKISYYNPYDYFLELSEVATDSRLIQILYKDKDATGLIVNKGKTRQLTAKVSPSTAKDKEIVWKSSDESIVTVNNGLVKAIKPGTATISCVFKNGKGITDYCTIVVPTKVSYINATCSINNGDYEYQFNDVIDVELKTNSEGKKVAKIDFNAEIDENASFKAVKWSFTDKNGNKVNESKAKLNAKGTLTSSKAMTSTDYYIVTATAQDITSKDKTSDILTSVSYKVRIVQPVEQIKLKNLENEADGLGKVLYLSRNPKKFTFSDKYYEILPANATYKDDVYIKVDANLAQIANLTESGNDMVVKAVTKGNGTLTVASYHGSGGRTVESAAFKVKINYGLNKVWFTEEEHVMLPGEKKILNYETDPSGIDKSKLQNSFTTHNNAKVSINNAQTGEVQANIGTGAYADSAKIVLKSEDDQMCSCTVYVLGLLVTVSDFENGKKYVISPDDKYIPYFETSNDSLASIISFGEVNPNEEIILEYDTDLMELTQDNPNPDCPRSYIVTKFPKKEGAEVKIKVTIKNTGLKEGKTLTRTREYIIKKVSADNYENDKEINMN